MIAQVPTTADPTVEAIERYVDATGGGGGAADFPWVLVVALVVLVVALVVVLGRLRKLQAPGR